MPIFEYTCETCDHCFEKLVFSEDEEPHRCSIPRVPELRPAFKKDGTITAGNASSINDGAAMLLPPQGSHVVPQGLQVVAQGLQALL